MTSQNQTLNMRLDRASKSALVRAAALRGLKMSDYVRTVLVAQARREVASSGRQVLALTADEQLRFWIALQEKPKPTAAQRRLGRLMRGGS